MCWDILGKFPDNPAARDAVVHLLKVFEYNVNLDYSVKPFSISAKTCWTICFRGQGPIWGISGSIGGYADARSQPHRKRLGQCRFDGQRGQSVAPQSRNPDLHPRREILSPRRSWFIEQLRRDPGLSAYSDNRLGVEPAEAAKVLKTTCFPVGGGGGQVPPKRGHPGSGDGGGSQHCSGGQGYPQALEEGVSRLIDTLSRVANVGNILSPTSMSLCWDANRAKFAENQVFGKRLPWFPKLCTTPMPLRRLCVRPKACPSRCCKIKAP